MKWIIYILVTIPLMPDQNVPLGSVATERACDKRIESLLETKRNFFEENKLLRMFEPYIELACVKSDAVKV
jgi:hypothetical protein